MDVARTENAQLADRDVEAAARVDRANPATDRLNPLSRPVPGSDPGTTRDRGLTPAEDPPDMFRAVEGRWGSREVEILGVDLVAADGQPGHVFQSGEAMQIRLRLRANQPVTDFVFGVGIFNAEGICCYGTNTAIEGATPGELSGDGEVRFAIDSLDLVDGTYKLDVAVHRENGAPYDYHRLLYTFRVKSRLKEVGIFRPPHRWQFSGGVRISGLS
jgi:hypothetical protein